MTTQPQPFNPQEHLIHLKAGQTTQEYLPVAWRLVWFRSVCPDGTIDTEEMEYDTQREVEAEVFVWNAEKKRSEKVIKKARGYARYRAVVTDGKGGRATGTKSENAANFADYGEKAETGAIGRALAALGYGTQFAPEFDEEHRIVDSPQSLPDGQQAVVMSRQAMDRTTARKTSPASSGSELATIPVVSQLKADVAALQLKNTDGSVMTWEEVIAHVFKKPIAEGKVTLEALLADTGPDAAKRVGQFLAAVKEARKAKAA